MCGMVYRTRHGRTREEGIGFRPVSTLRIETERPEFPQVLILCAHSGPGVIRSQSLHSMVLPGCEGSLILLHSLSIDHKVSRFHWAPARVVTESNSKKSSQSIIVIRHLCLLHSTYRRPPCHRQNPCSRLPSPNCLESITR